MIASEIKWLGYARGPLLRGKDNLRHTCRHNIDVEAITYLVLNSFVVCAFNHSSKITENLRCESRLRRHDAIQCFGIQDQQHRIFHGDNSRVAVSLGEVSHFPQNLPGDKDMDDDRLIPMHGWRLPEFLKTPL